MKVIDGSLRRFDVAVGGLEIVTRKLMARERLGILGPG